MATGHPVPVMNDRARYKAILRAARAGLATVHPPDTDYLFARTEVCFDLPGGISVEICCERSSVQVITDAEPRRAIAGAWGARRILRALSDNGWVDPHNPNDAWQTLDYYVTADPS